MNELLEALRTLANASSEESRKLIPELNLDLDPDADPEEIVAEALSEEASQVWHVIQNRGYSAARSKYEKKAETAKAEAKKHRKEAESLRSDVEELSKDNPDIEKIKKEAAQKIQEAEERARQKEEESNRLLGNVVVSQKQAELESRLKEVFASKTMARAFAQLYADRFEPVVEEDDMDVQVLQADSEIPYQAVGEREPLDLLVEEIKQEADPADLRSNTDSGGGERGGGGPGPKKGLLDQAAEEGKAKAEQQATSSDGSWIDQMERGL